MKHIIILASIIAMLTACSPAPLKPIVDHRNPQSAMYPYDLSQCRTIAAKAVQGDSFMVLSGIFTGRSLGAGGRQERMDEKERIVLKACLEGRGHKIIY